MSSNNKNGFERFESIYVIGFTGYIDRLDKMKRELSRVGVSDYSVQLDFKNAFDGVVCRTIRHTMADRFLNVTLGHYAAIKTAYDLGKENVLLIEDDLRFFRDTERLRRSVEALPSDYDCALLDSFCFMRFNAEAFRRLKAGSKVGEGWVRCPVKRVSSACYALSRRGMERLIELYELAADGKGILQCCDQMFEPRIWNGYNFYCAVPQIGIQQDTSGVSTTSTSLIRRIYEGEGVDFGRYADYDNTPSKPPLPVPHIVYQVWTDSKTPMSANRERCFKASRTVFGVECRLVTPEDIPGLAVKGHPFHPAYRYLSAIQKADYLRCYIANFHGGGYADIKEYSRNNNWNACFAKMDADSGIQIMGETETMGGSPFKEWNVKGKIEKLLVNGWFIARPHSQYTEEWFMRVTRFLDGKLSALRRHPAMNAREKDPRYPIRWADLGGSIQHRLEMEFQETHPGAISHDLRSGRTSTPYQ